MIGSQDEGDKPTLGQSLMLFMGKTIMRVVAQDERESVKSIKQSNLDWIVVPEYQIVIGPSIGSYRVGYWDANGNSSVTCGDLAAFILEDLKKGQFIRQMRLVRN